MMTSPLRGRGVGGLEPNAEVSHKKTWAANRGGPRKEFVNLYFIEIIIYLKQGYIADRYSDNTKS